MEPIDADSIKVVMSLKTIDAFNYLSRVFGTICDASLGEDLKGPYSFYWQTGKMPFEENDGNDVEPFQLIILNIDVNGVITNIHVYGNLIDQDFRYRVIGYCVENDILYVTENEQTSEEAATEEMETMQRDENYKLN